MQGLLLRIRTTLFVTAGFLLSGRTTKKSRARFSTPPPWLPACFKHLHICGGGLRPASCLAHLLLTHRSLNAQGAKASKPHQQVKLPPMSTRLTDLRAQIVREEIQRLLKGNEHAKLRDQLYDYLAAA